MLNLFCAALAEKSAGIFVMTLTDLDIAESCSRLMEAIQQLSQTIKQLESFHVKQQQQKLKTIVTSPMGGPPSLSSLPAQAPTEVPVNPLVPVAETAVASASTAPPPPPPVSKSPPPAPQLDGKIQPAIIEETTVDPVPEESPVLPQAEEAEVTETEITQPLTEAISPLPTTEAAASPPLPTISEPDEENYINKEESTVSPVPTVQEITEGVPAVVPEVSEVPKTVEEVVPEVPTEPKEVPNVVPEVPAVVPKVEDEAVETSSIQSDL